MEMQLGHLGKKDLANQWLSTMNSTEQKDQNLKNDS